MRPPLTGRPGLPLPMPGPSIPLPSGDPFDHPLFGLSLLHPRNRALAGALSKSWGETMVGMVEEEEKREENNDSAAAETDATNCVVNCKPENGEEQRGKDAKRMSDRELDKAAKANGYRDAHDLKKAYKVGKESDIFKAKDGEMFIGPRLGTGAMEATGLNVKGY